MHSSAQPLPPYDKYDQLVNLVLATFLTDINDPLMPGFLDTYKNFDEEKLWLYIKIALSYREQFFDAMCRILSNLTPLSAQEIACLMRGDLEQMAHTITEAKIRGEAPAFKPGSPQDLYTIFRELFRRFHIKKALESNSKLFSTPVSLTIHATALFNKRPESVKMQITGPLAGMIDTLPLWINAQNPVVHMSSNGGTHVEVALKTEIPEHPMTTKLYQQFETLESSSPEETSGTFVPSESLNPLVELALKTSLKGVTLRVNRANARPPIQAPLVKPTAELDTSMHDFPLSDEGPIFRKIPIYSAQEIANMIAEDLQKNQADLAIGSERDAHRYFRDACMSLHIARALKATPSLFSEQVTVAIQAPALVNGLPHFVKMELRGVLAGIIEMLPIWLNPTDPVVRVQLALREPHLLDSIPSRAEHPITTLLRLRFEAISKPCLIETIGSFVEDSPFFSRAAESALPSFSRKKTAPLSSVMLQPVINMIPQLKMRDNTPAHIPPSVSFSAPPALKNLPSSTPDLNRRPSP